MRSLEPRTGVSAATRAVAWARLGAMDPVGVTFVHTVIEAAKLAFADREAYYGDPNFVTVAVGDAVVR